jgi:GT2 family glycosyltransferase
MYTGLKKLKKMVNHTVPIVIVNYNSTRYTLQCIDSVYRSAADDAIHIIVIDNGSTDSPERIEERYPEVELVCNPDNIGFSKAVNLALKRATGELLVLLNPDTIVCSGFFSGIVRYVTEHKDVAIAGPKIYDHDGTVQGSARRFPTPLTAMFGRQSFLNKVFPNNRVSRKEFICHHCNMTRPIEVDWVSGACMVLRKQALDEAGGFDERFFLYWEDADLCKRLTKTGWRIIYFPPSEVYHISGTSSETAPFFSIFHFHKSCYRYYRRHAQWPTKLMVPFAMLGLGGRCLFAMGWIAVQRVLKSNRSVGSDPF